MTGSGRWLTDGEPTVLVLIACTACGDATPNNAVIELPGGEVRIAYSQRGRRGGERLATSELLGPDVEHELPWCEVHGEMKKIPDADLDRLARIGRRKGKPHFAVSAPVDANRRGAPLMRVNYWFTE